LNTTKNILEIAKNTILEESKSIANLTQYLTEDFATCVNLILASKQRLVVTGIGKSAIIAQKIVATLNSTGTPSLFLHAAEAVHGDLGMVQKGDIIIIISYGILDIEEAKTFKPSLVFPNEKDNSLT
jgi:arabinose-5-phosphate isomerase